MTDTVTLREYLEILSNSDNAIMQAIGEWSVDALDNYGKDGATVKDIIRHLETTDCGACHAPSGLIYNSDLAKKLSEWHVEISDALEGYHDATGEAWGPNTKKGQSFLTYVWFAVEWNAHEIAREIEQKFEAGELAENPQPAKPEAGEGTPKFKRADVANTKTTADTTATAKQPRKPSGGGMKM